jgi:hypothetical protein
LLTSVRGKTGQKKISKGGPNDILAEAEKNLKAGTEKKILWVYFGLKLQH